MRLLPYRPLRFISRHCFLSRQYTSSSTAQTKRAPEDKGEVPVRLKSVTTRTRNPPRQIVFSGIQPTGVPHLGNYLGALRQWRDLQDESMRNQARDPANWTALHISVVDLHSLTGHQTGEERLQMSRDTFASLLAIGLDPKPTNIFFQSHNPHHAELMWILSTVASTGYLSRMTQWKSKLELPDDATLDSDATTEKLKLGLFSYPVLQAADILLYNATMVPVGEDQSQHIELARSLARSFNAHGGKGEKILIEPRPIISPAKRILSLRDPTSKMSKSAPNPKSRILITDSAADIKDKLRGAITDLEEGISFDPIRRPGVSNLVEILKHISRSEESCKDIARQHTSMTKKAFKELVADEIIKAFEGFRDRFEELRQPGNRSLDEAIKHGAERALMESQPTMARVRRALGLYPLLAT